MTDSCKDCRFYLPVDVFSGICKVTKEKILPEDPFCKEAEKMPKCKFCQHFTAGNEFLGKCSGSILAYPDLIALKCTEFEWLHQN